MLNLEIQKINSLIGIQQWLLKNLLKLQLFPVLTIWQKIF